MINKSTFFTIKILLFFLCLGVFKISSAQTYCTPSLNTNTNIYWVDSIKTINAAVNLHYINHPNPLVNSNGYTDLSTTTFNADVGTTFDMFMQGRTLYSYHWNVYIDWNENGILNDPGEMVISYLGSPQLTNYTAPITVPLTTTQGNKRVRVMMLRIGTTTDPCINATATYGYITDFTLIVGNGQCPGPLFVDSATVNICSGDQYIVGNNIYNTTGTYTDVFQDVNACDSTIVTQLTVHDSYLYETEDSIYVGDTYSFLDETYQFSGLYTKNYKTEAGCDSNFVLKLKVIPVVYDTIRNEICQGDSILVNGNYYKNNTNKNDTIIENWGHRVTHIVVKVNPLPNINVRPLNTTNTSYCIGDTVTLIATGSIKYDWFLYERDSTYKRIITDSSILASKIFFATTTFKVEGIDENNCKNFKEFTLNGENCCEIQIPNAFSPNNDGLNDEFRIIVKSQPQQLNIRIFNRVGQLVYSSNNINDTWKGNDAKGNPLASDVYFSTVKGQCWDGTVIDMKGDVTIVR